MINKRMTFEAIQKASDGNYYGSDQNGNGIYRIDINTGCSSYISLFEIEAIDKKRLHAKAENYGKLIIFIPASADNITMFDPITTKMYQKKIPIPSVSYPYYDPKYKFIDSYIINDCLILLPSTYPGVLIYDLTADSFELIDNWITKEKFFFRKGSCRIKDTVFIPDTLSDLVISFDLASNEVRRYHTGGANKGCWSCNSFNGNDIWLSPKNRGPIIKWCPWDNSIKEYSNYPDRFSTKDFMFSKVFFINDKPYFIPVYSNMIVTVDEDEEIIKSVACEYINEFTIVIFHFEMENYLYISIINNDKTENGFIINKSNGSLTHLDFSISDGQEKRLIDLMKLSQNCLKESHIFDIDMYLSGLESKVSR